MIRRCFGSNRFLGTIILVMFLTFLYLYVYINVNKLYIVSGDLKLISNGPAETVSSPLCVFFLKS